MQTNQEFKDSMCGMWSEKYLVAYWKSTVATSTNVYYGMLQRTFNQINKEKLTMQGLQENDKLLDTEVTEIVLGN